MIIRCVIIDDEPLAIKIMQEHLSQLADMELIASFQNPMEAFEFLSEHTIDLLFADIQMPLLTGIDLVKSLVQPPSVIFTTAHRGFALESYDLEAVDYLLKPVTFSRFFKAVNKYKSQNRQVSKIDVNQHKALKEDHLYVNSNKKFIKVLFSSILYIESLKDYIKIHTENQAIVTKDTISGFMDKLPKQFIRIHRSFIINRDKITAFTSLDIELGTKEIPIGNSYKAEVLARLKKQ